MIYDTVYENECFRGLTLTGETIRNTRFTECEFRDSIFSAAEIQNCALRGCRFVRCRIDSPRGRETSVTNAEFDGCFLSGVQWCEFVSGNRYASLFLSMEDSTVRYSNFTQMKLPRFDFSTVRFAESLFAECDLSGANFRTAVLDRTEFFRTDLTNADFRDASGYQIDILTCKVKGARFSFPEAMSLLGSLGVKID